MLIKFWIYTSKSLLVGEEADRLLPELVAHWQDTNRAGLITGALIFTGSMFAQYIEGPEPAIASLREAICVDERHVSIRTVDMGSIEKRSFEQWTLAYSGHAAPFDRLVAKARDGTPMVGRTLLLEMMRRFTSGA